ncbi:uncharacterized protein EDB91DRAFT_217822 [Suillus paluster]|uniref:uncharacterized protein n=1 Tax=Suillus paluster TaxID=48578 RepID=UPI001B87EB6F|nr:uncharacterized protein EDB91DRAFT_217822 [Suillus paluster]KAG1743609.1 hypothetical protein EDB91DRAFT_217822 [Suillus paluster]
MMQLQQRQRKRKGKNRCRSRIQKTMEFSGLQNMQGNKHAGGRQTLLFCCMIYASCRLIGLVLIPLIAGLVFTQFSRSHTFTLSSWAHSSRLTLSLFHFIFLMYAFSGLRTTLTCVFVPYTVLYVLVPSYRDNIQFITWIYLSDIQCLNYLDDEQCRKRNYVVDAHLDRT